MPLGTDFFAIIGTKSGCGDFLRGVLFFRGAARRVRRGWCRGSEDGAQGAPRVVQCGGLRSVSKCAGGNRVKRTAQRTSLRQMPARRKGRGQRKNIKKAHKKKAQGRRESAAPCAGMRVSFFIFSVYGSPCGHRGPASDGARVLRPHPLRPLRPRPRQARLFLKG